MESINITINGQKIMAKSGQTILEAAKAAGIEIPTLCYHPALKPIGACRVCLVEVRGQRSLQPACTFPVTEKMEIQTKSQKVVQARKFVLQLIFSERNHFCMYCEMSGDCELQKLGYSYGLDHWVHPTYTQNFPVDASPTYFLLDHNRCVLCRRCIRACSELVANRTLDLSQRGALTMLSADMNVSLAESSCISCGTCLDVCPTGSLVDKRSAFIARDIDTEHIRSICSQCSLGCGLDIVVRDEKILRIQGQWDAPVNHGLLCRKGRFDPFYEDRQRILQPLLRQGSMEIVVSWDHALKQVSEKIGKITPQKLGVLTTTQATNEALYLIKKLFMRELKVKYLGLLNQVVPKLSTHTVSSLVDISISDCILIVGSDPVNTHPVASFSVKRTVDKGTQLIVVNSQETSLASYADRTFMLSEIEQAIKIVNRAEQPVVLYSTGATKQTCKALAKLKSKATFLALQPGVNTQAAVAYGLNKIFNPSAVEVAYIVAGEQNDNFGEIIEKFQKDTFIIVQASYHTALTQRADVVLPMSTWLECSGTLTNTWGLVQDVHMAISPPGRSKMDWQILFLLAKKLEKEWSVSLAEISGNTALQF